MKEYTNILTSLVSSYDCEMDSELLVTCVTLLAA